MTDDDPTAAGQQPTEALLAAYDAELRGAAEVSGAEDVVHEGPLFWAVFDHGGFVGYHDLGGLAGAALDDLVARTVAHFRDDTDVGSFEWKTRGHDDPADLGGRLEAQGLVPEPVSSARPPDRFAVRLTLPEPIGLEEDVRGWFSDLGQRVPRPRVRRDAIAQALRGPTPPAAATR